MSLFMRRASFVLFVLCVLAFLGSLARAQEPTLIRIGHTASYKHHCQTYLRRWANAVTEQTEGRYRIEIYPSNLYGRPEDLLAGCEKGKTDMVLAEAYLLSAYSPKYGVLNLPFLFENNAHAERVLNGPVGNEIAQSLAEKNIIVVGWWDGGMQHLFTSTPVLSPDDLAGKKMRVTASNEAADTARALGAEPVPMPYSQTYPALQQKIIDGCDGTTIQLLNQRYYDVISNCCLLSYMHVPLPLVASRRLWESLPEADREIFLSEGRKTSEFSFRNQAKAEVLEIELAKAFGVQFAQPEYAAFVQRVQPVWQKYHDAYGDLLDRILTEK